MKLFDARAARAIIRAAIAHAAEGGQALHVWDPGEEAARTWPKAPQVFRLNRPWAHLFDQDESRLIATARRLGVRVIVVSGKGTRRQHIDLCAGPLARAMEESER